MKKIFMIIIMLFCANIILFAEWEHRFSTNNFINHIQINDELFMGRESGLTKLNTKTNEYTNYSIFNSALPGNNFNSFLQINKSDLLISTKQGLCLYKDGKIIVNEAICKDYPDTDSRNLYKDALGRIWTFSSHQVHYFDKGIWNTINLEDSVSYSFDIWDLSITKNSVWVMYNDNENTEANYYNKDLKNLLICVAIIKDKKITRIYDSIDEFPQKNGDYSICSSGDDIYWKSQKEIYKYENNNWDEVYDFDYNNNQPAAEQKLLQDEKGNIWYTVSDETSYTAFPVCYDVKTGATTPYLNVDEEQWIPKLHLFDKKHIVAQSPNCFYILKDTGWVKIIISSLNLAKNTRIEKLLFIAGKLYFKVSVGLSFDENLICAEGDNILVSLNQNLPFSKLSNVEINKNGKGIYRGINVSYQLQLENDSGFVRLDNMSEMKTLENGEVYFTQRNNFLYTWEGNKIIERDFGFADKTRPELLKFDFCGDYIIGLGQYKYHEDSLNIYLSIYDTKKQSFKLFDKHSSDLPDYFFTSGGISYPRDTIPVDIAIDKDFNPWILTSESLFKFSENGSEFIELESNDSIVNCHKILYDQNSNEILLYDSYHNQLYTINYNQKNINSIDLSNSGIIGKIIKLKKLMDSDVWASDELGYLYKYAGNGKFDIFDLLINNRKNLKIPINDFSLDFNRNLHLATDIGLLSNKTILSDVAENSNVSREGLSIYPNPAEDYITIQTSEVLETSEVSKVQIFDILGLEVGQSSLIDGNIWINVSNLQSGVYFIRIGDKVEKFVKM
ncbi:MAG: T9SS type A sorting domain-containing protein [Candidatus Kapabacteria bacterium]|nr:T9SS type A sorting domain-containing protein [Candidatus Kapabacteria bacterium]